MKKSKVLFLCVIVSLVTWFLTIISMDSKVFVRNIPSDISYSAYIDMLERYVNYADSTLFAQDSLINTHQSIFSYSKCAYDGEKEKYDSLVNDMIRLNEKCKTLKYYNQ